MKNTTKTLLAVSALAGLSFTTAQAATTIYSQDFTTAPTSVSVGANATIGDGNTIGFGDFGYAAVQAGFSVNTGKMVMGQPTLNADTQGAAGVFIDTSSLSAGTYTYSFDVLDYVAGGANTEASFGLYEGNNDGTMAIRFGAANAPAVTYPIDESAGSSTFELIGPRAAISANGTISASFTLTEAGSAGDFLALTWFQAETANQSGVTNTTFSIDNISVAVVPEPGTYALIGGLLAMSYVMVRRRL